MITPISFLVSLNTSDYYRAMRAFSLHQRSIRLTIYLLSLISFLAIVVTITTQSISFATGLFPLFLFFIIMTIFFVNPANVADKVSKDERLYCEANWVVDEDKISIKDKFTETSLDWGTFWQAFETKEHYMLSLSSSKNCIKVLPKRVFLSDAQQEDFRALLEAKTKPIMRIRSVSLPELSRKTCMIILYGLVALFIIILATTNFLLTSNSL